MKSYAAPAPEYGSGSSHLPYIVQNSILKFADPSPARKNAALATAPQL
jgi:hypothetical protein